MFTLNHTTLSTDIPTAEAPRKTGFSILAYCMALPLFGRAVFPLARDKAHITLASSFTDPQILATYLAAAVVAIGICTAGNPAEQTNRGRQILLFMLFVVICFASSFGSRFPLFSIWRCLEVALLGAWAVVMARNSTEMGDPQKAIRAFYGISVAILVAVFIGLVINPSGAWAMEGDVARLMGSAGYSINSNDIGAIAAVIGVGCYVRAVERGSLKFVIGTVVFVAVCYVTHSRGSYIALAFGIFAATLMLGRVAHRRSTILLLGSGVALSIVTVALVSHEVRDFFLFLMTRGHETQNFESFGGRLQLWEFGLTIFSQHPYLGTGYGTYPEGLEGGHFHNVFIELLVTTGALGLAGYVAFLLAMGAAVRKSIGRLGAQEVSARITSTDLVTIPAVILAANGATAGAAYYSWDLLGLISVAVAASALMARRHIVSAGRPAPVPSFSNLLR